MATTAEHHQPRILAKIERCHNRGVGFDDELRRVDISFPQVIFSLGTAPEYDPKLVVESLI